jgi:pimeloyl-ACP methyl ester carboxylesterase
LLLHGFPDNHAIWRDLTPLLVSGGYRVIAPDMRGFGETEMAPNVSDYLIETAAAPDVLEIIAALSIERAHIVGHDFGAPVAWRLAAEHPDLFITLTALSVGHPRAFIDAGWEQKRRSLYMVFHQLRGVAERLYLANDGALMRRFWREHPDLDRAVSELSRPDRLRAGLNWYRANIGVDRMIVTPKPGAFGEEIVRIPTLGVWSEEPYLTEAQMAASGAYVDASWRFAILDGAGHWIQATAPDRLAPLLLRHFQAHSH